MLYYNNSNSFFASCFISFIRSPISSPDNPQDTSSKRITSGLHARALAISTFFLSGRARLLVVISCLSVRLVSSMISSTDSSIPFPYRPAFALATRIFFFWRHTFKGYHHLKASAYSLSCDLIWRQAGNIFSMIDNLTFRLVYRSRI